MKFQCVCQFVHVLGIRKALFEQVSANYIEIDLLGSHKGRLAMHKQYQNMRKETLEPAPRLLPRESLALRKARLEALSPFGQIPAENK